MATFRASGNVVFTAGGAVQKQLTGRIEKGLAKSLGYEVPVFLRSAAEVAAIAAARAIPDRDRGLRRQAPGLPAVPASRRRGPARGDRMSTDEDRLAIRGRSSLAPERRHHETALDLRRVERLIGPSTRRTKE